MQILPFNFENNKIRTILLDNEPWFIAKDIFSVLEINSKGGQSDSLANLDEDERSSFKTNTSGGYQNMAIVSESGLYSLIIRSRKAIAKPFQKWVTKEVLPSIRKTGNYSINSSQPKENIDLDEILVISKKMLELASMFGLSRESRYLSADSGVEKITGNSPLKLLGISQRISMEDMPRI